ncbi:hypothetical protein FZEAL_5225 [Fusarium zealandicum]|uniref:C2H2-type domain-containing protein n=1 Tax=Fusarium zealandicum TaxID=1053134 RepID=A0A8H4XJZ8_9HYPO|nr:hypothetical protein FZEAL_5225 [Fusarium zealandicum]
MEEEEPTPAPAPDPAPAPGRRPLTDSGTTLRVPAQEFVPNLCRFCKKAYTKNDAVKKHLGLAKGRGGKYWNSCDEYKKVLKEAEEEKEDEEEAVVELPKKRQKKTGRK